MISRENFESVYKETAEVILNHQWESQDFYAMWSAQTYYYVRHSTRLFSAAATRCPLDANPVHNRLLHHLAEENGHENLSSADLKHMKIKVKNLPELASTQGMYQSQFYWIEHVHPYAFFGYLLALEGIAVHAGPEIYRRSKEAHGERSSRFLKVHTEEDVDHLSEVFVWFDKFSESEKEVIFKNFKLSCQFYCNMLQESSERAGETLMDQAA